MEVTLLGIVTLVNPLQRLNASRPMLVTLLGMVTLVNPLQRMNALTPMEVTLCGIFTLVNPLQPSNARVPMEVTGRSLIVAGITKAPVALGLLPVMVIVLAPEYNNSAFSDAGRMSSSART